MGFRIHEGFDQQGTIPVPGLDLVGQPGQRPALTIESTWRMAYVLAMLNREQLLDAGRENELEEFVTEAREVMQETMTERPA